MNQAPPYVLSPSDACSPLSMPPSHTALLLLDFHTFIISHNPDAAQKALEKAILLRQWSKHHNLIVIHCLIDLKAHTSPTRKMSSKTNSVRARMAESLPEDHAEHPSIRAEGDEYVFYRSPGHVSAMGSYGIKEFLREHGIRSLILAGLSTGGCVLNTAKGAADQGFVVSVVEDACADRDEVVHSLVMERVLVGQCHVLGLEELEKDWVWRGENGDGEEVEWKNGLVVRLREE